METGTGVNALTIVFAALCIFAIAYRFYGLFIATKVLSLNEARKTPAVKYSDGQDYVPTNKYVLFGHHFAAIAAAGPLLGPVLAAQFGYMPGLLWILIGCVLAGGVHDMVVLFCSVRHRGRSLAYIATQEIDRTTGFVASWAVLAILILTLAGLSIAVVSLIIPYTDPRLLRNDVADIAVSPFTLVFEHAGLLSAAALMNAVILTSVLSAGNSGLYASTRMLFVLAHQGSAPKIFGKLSASGVPRNALFATTAVAGLCFLTSLFDNQSVYLWLLNTSGMSGFIAWLGIAISHYRFRRGYVMNGYDVNKLPYKSSFFPFGPMLAFALCMVIMLGQNYQAFLEGTIDWAGVVATYIGIPLFLAIWLGYKLITGCRFVRYSDMKFPEKYR